MGLAAAAYDPYWRRYPYYCYTYYGDPVVGTYVVPSATTTTVVEVYVEKPPTAPALPLSTAKSYYVTVPRDIREGNRVHVFRLL